MELVIKQKEIKPWLAALKDDFQVFEVNNDLLPPKQYFFPPREDIFILRRKKNKLVIPKTNQPFLLFGLPPYDLQAIDQLDEIMKGEHPDYYYWQKRNNSVLVGLSDYCLELASGGDLILEKINQQEYRAFVMTDQGRKLIKSKFFSKVKKPKIVKYQPPENPLKPLLRDSELLARAVEWSWQSNHQVWEELAGQCLACGICAYLCPICHCFSIEDRVTLNNQKCIRCREWDACTLPKFSQIAGGHNFHKTIKERYYNWYYHKFVRAYRQYGRAQCVACGRCRNNCPAGISIYQVLKRVTEDYKKKFS